MTLQELQNWALQLLIGDRFSKHGLWGIPMKWINVAHEAILNGMKYKVLSGSRAEHGSL